MKYFEKVPAVLMLEDGSIWHGFSAGKIGTATGEICFNTGMTGYQEIFTDPSYFGQILVMTNVHIGNYGIHEPDQESDSMKISGLVCRNFTNLFSRKTADQSIQEYFLEEGMIGISDVDTRAIVRHIRDKGAMNAIISSEISDPEALRARLDKVPSMQGLELATKVTTREPYEFGDDSAAFRVAVLDLGVKASILQCLAEAGCRLCVFPATTTYEEMAAWNPDGYFFSNGPGDPAPLDFAIRVATDILEHDHPFFGICLGHQVLALACGMETFKMHHGHRGSNHPVLNLETGCSEITTQNHGFAVRAESVEANKDRIAITHINLNDQTVEGIRIKGRKAFSVQYHPEASPGPHDSRYLFKQFTDLMKK